MSGKTPSHHPEIRCVDGCLWRHPLLQTEGLKCWRWHRVKSLPKLKGLKCWRWHRVKSLPKLKGLKRRRRCEIIDAITKNRRDIRWRQRRYRATTYTTNLKRNRLQIPRHNRQCSNSVLRRKSAVAVPIPSCGGIGVTLGVKVAPLRFFCDSFLRRKFFCASLRLIVASVRAK
jgi:hypothetical protein